MGLASLLQLNTLMVDLLADKHWAWKLAKKAAKSAALSDIEVPKLTKKNWKDFSKALSEAFGRQEGGINSVPLSYIFRDNDLAIMMTHMTALKSSLLLALTMWVKTIIQIRRLCTRCSP